MPRIVHGGQPAAAGLVLSPHENYTTCLLTPRRDRDPGPALNATVSAKSLPSTLMVGFSSCGAVAVRVWLLDVMAEDAWSKSGSRPASLSTTASSLRTLSCRTLCLWCLGRDTMTGLEITVLPEVLGRLHAHIAVQQ